VTSVELSICYNFKMKIDFECPRCGVVIEREFGIGEPPVCFECKVDMLRKYSVGGIFFKGDGFARNSRNSR